MNFFNIFIFIHFILIYIMIPYVLNFVNKKTDFFKKRFIYFLKNACNYSKKVILLI